MPLTAAQAALQAAVAAYIEAEGIEEAEGFLAHLGDEFGLWKDQPPVFTDPDQRAAQVLAQALADTRCGQRFQLIAALRRHLASPMLEVAA